MKSLVKRNVYLLFANGILKGGYYGFRAILVLFLINETEQFDQQSTFELYGWFTGILTFSYLLGGLMGSLLSKPRDIILLGAVTSAIGLITFINQSEISIYIGLGLLILGTGFIKPNIQAGFGIQNLAHQKLLDARFTSLYLSTNIGSMLGVVVIPLVAESLGYQAAFISAAILHLMGGAIAYFNILENASEALEKASSQNGYKLAAITVLSLIIVLFWASFETISSSGIIRQMQSSSMRRD